MLVITRQKNEKLIMEIPPSTEARRVVICLSDAVPIRSGARVRLGITAPKDIKILRKELVDGLAT